MGLAAQTPWEGAAERGAAAHLEPPLWQRRVSLSGPSRVLSNTHGNVNM